MRISDWSSDVCSSDLGGAHPFGLHQHVERALGGLNPADRLDFGAADGLVIGDDRQHLGGGTRQFARVVAFAAQRMRKVGRRLAMPMPAAHDEFDLAARVTPRDGLDEIAYRKSVVWAKRVAFTVAIGGVVYRKK